MIEVTTADEFKSFMIIARPGERAIYYRGYLARDLKIAGVRELAYEAALASKHGMATLTQRKLGKDSYEYLATRR
jgi:hypothetical protein